MRRNPPRASASSRGRVKQPTLAWSSALLLGSCTALLRTGGVPRPAWAPEIWQSLRASRPLAATFDEHVLLFSAWLAWFGLAVLSAASIVRRRWRARERLSPNCHRSARAATVTLRTLRRPATGGTDSAEHAMPPSISSARACDATPPPPPRGLPLGSFGLLLRGTRRLVARHRSEDAEAGLGNGHDQAEQLIDAVPPERRLWLPPVVLHDGEWSRLVVAVLSRGATEEAGHRVRRMLVNEVEIVVELADDGEPGSPFEQLGPRRWRLPRDSSLLPLVPPEQHNRAVRKSLLVHLCQEDQRPTAHGRRLELVDLACLRTTALVGPPEKVDAALALAVVDTVGHRWSDAEGLLLVGFGEEMTGIEGVCVVPDIASALGALDARSRHVREGTTLVVVPRALDVELPEPSRADDQGLQDHEATLFAALVDRIESDPSLALLSAVGHERMRETLSLGRDRDESPSLVEIGTRPSRRESASSRSSGQAPPPPSQRAGVDVQVLGPLVIVGTERDLRRSYRLAELVAYLALHPHGAASSAWSAALWPDRRVPGQTIANRLCEARRALGGAPDGQPRLRRGGAGHVLVDVDSDWRRFTTLARAASPPEWEEALALVRGRPFEGSPFGDWVVHDGFLGEMETSIGELANRLCDHLLESDEPRRAEAAARTALRAVPYDESLYRVLMRCADAEGNRAKLDALLDELGRLLECRRDPLSAVHPETAALYRALSSRRVHAAG